MSRRAASTPATLKANFADLHPAAGPHEARVEADRCYFCYDAPCQQACPTSIDIPLFIREIAAGNPLGAARDDSRRQHHGRHVRARLPDRDLVRGSLRARGAPRASRCASACCSATRSTRRWRRARPPFTRAAPTGKRVAIVGAGPAGLACAHALARRRPRGRRSSRRARNRPASTNTASPPTRRPDDFAAREVAFILSIGGIDGEARRRARPRRDARASCDAITTRCSSASASARPTSSGSPGEGELANVVDAVDYIAATAAGRGSDDAAGRPARRRDRRRHDGGRRRGAVEAARRRDSSPSPIAAASSDMKASRLRARTRADQWRARSAPGRGRSRSRAMAARSAASLFERTREENGELVGAGEPFRIEADVVFTAIGQTADARRSFGGEPRSSAEGRPLVVDAERRTSLPGRLGGRRLRRGRPGSDVSAVEDGKQAARSIDAALRAGPRAEGAPTWSIFSADFLGIKSPNPFWLASAPPTDRKTNVERAFRAGWGGVVWKTLGEAGPPVVNVSGARYGAIHGRDRRLIALQQHRAHHRPRSRDQSAARSRRSSATGRTARWSTSLMVPCDEESWKKILARVEETECDGVELNFGCPHGMSRARHGLGGRPGARIYRDGHALVQGAHADAGDRQADAQHHRHPPARARGQGRAAPTRSR